MLDRCSETGYPGTQRRHNTAPSGTPSRTRPRNRSRGSRPCPPSRTRRPRRDRCSDAGYPDTQRRHNTAPSGMLSRTRPRNRSSYSRWCPRLRTCRQRRGTYRDAQPTRTSFPSNTCPSGTRHRVHPPVPRQGASANNRQRRPQRVRIPPPRSAAERPMLFSAYGASCGVAYGVLKAPCRALPLSITIVRVSPRGAAPSAR